MNMVIFRLAVLSVFVSLPLQSQSARAEDSPWQPDVKITAGYNDNLGQAQFGRDIVSSYFAALNLGIDYKKALNPGQIFTLRGFLETVQWEAVRDMSRISAGGNFNYDWQPTPGPTAISYHADILLRADDYRSHKQRDSTIFSAKFSATKPFTENVRASFGVEYRDRDSSGTVWDLNSARGFLSGAYNFRPTWSVYGTYSYAYGDVWSNAQTVFDNGKPADDIFGLVSAADAIEPDEAFNSEFCSNSPCNWLAYRLTAHTNIFEIGIDKELGQNMLADLSYSYIDVNARGDNNYDVQIVRLSLLKRF